jgi:hypothetical protein
MLPTPAMEKVVEMAGKLAEVMEAEAEVLAVPCPIPTKVTELGAC